MYIFVYIYICIYMYIYIYTYILQTDEIKKQANYLLFGVVSCPFYTWLGCSSSFPSPFLLFSYLFVLHHNVWSRVHESEPDHLLISSKTKNSWGWLSLGLQIFGGRSPAWLAGLLPGGPASCLVALPPAWCVGLLLGSPASCLVGRTPAWRPCLLPGGPVSCLVGRYPTWWAGYCHYN